MEVIEKYTDELIPYANNPRNNDNAVDKVANSIKEFGFKVPIVIDRNNFIVAGHTRLRAAKKLGLKQVPCVVADDLTDEQVKAFRLADNKVAELATWDMDKLELELEQLEEFKMSDFGFKEQTSWFDRSELEMDERQEGNEEYNEFLDKFKLKKTTDDCYTPALVYDAVVKFVAEEYGKDPKKFIKPFYPGGDYTKENYKGKVVVDNPPFSILSEIVTYYEEQGVEFFLFAPHLTLFGGAGRNVCGMCTCNHLTYENGAVVSTSFLTNMEGDWRIKTSPKLYKMVQDANDENLRAQRKEIPKYSYPNEVVSAAIIGTLARYGEEFKVKKDECYHIRQLDSQKEYGKEIYGSGFLISKKAAAEKAAAVVWELSDNEKRIIEEMS